MRTPIRILLAAAILGTTLGANLAQAQADVPQVEIFVDRPRPAADDLVSITYTFTGSGLGSIRMPRELPLKNLQVVWGPATSTRVEFINMEVKRSVTVSYKLRPLGPGPAEVGETTWTAGDKSVKGHSYQLEVGPARNPGTGQPGQPGQQAPRNQPEEEEEDPFPSPFRWMEPRRGGVRNVAARPRDALVSYIVTPDRTSAYVGEEIVLHYELITQADISGLDFVEPPKFPGFWAEDIERPTQPQGRQDTVDGRPVTRFTLLKKAISGLTAGSFTVPAATIKLAVRLPGDPFSDPFSFVRPQIVQRSTNPVEIKILPIPDNPGFKGPVGSFQVSASADRTRVTVGDAVTVRVKISGTGNLRTATENPQLEVPNARVYPPTPKTNTARTGGRPSASSEWDYVVVPSAPGELLIPPVSFAVFDPALKKIVKRESQPISIRVEGSQQAAGAQTGPAATPAAEESTGAALTLPAGQAGTPPAVLSKKPEAKGTAIPTVDLSNQTVTIPIWLIAALPVVLLVGGGTFLAVRHRRRTALPAGLDLTPEPGETKERTAARIDRALRTVIARKCGVSDGVAVPALLQALAGANVPEETIEDVRRLLADLDFLRFAPQLGDYAAKLEETREQARHLFSRLS